MMITVFTPTYNRAYRLSALYESLCKQTCKDFEWLIVDDGSTDNTEELVRPWLQETSFSIRYIKQANGGKHRAINHGVLEAKGDLFFVVDSDDFLPQNSISIICQQYEYVKNDENYAGICGLKTYFDGRKVGGGENFGVLNCNSTDFRFRYKMKGDMAEVIRTDIMRIYPFPDLDKEKFCPEGLIYIRIARKYLLRYFYEDIYRCEYLEDGLTNAITKIRIKSPGYSTLYYTELFYETIPIVYRIKAAINYWRFEFCKGINKRNPINPIGWGILFKPLGYIYYMYDKKTIKNDNNGIK